MSSSNYPDSPLKVVLADDDPIFRLGICTALAGENFADIEVIAQGKPEDLTAILAETKPDLLILAIDLFRHPDILNYTTIICQELHNRYENLIIFLVTNEGTPATLKKIPGVKGYCSKGVAIEDLVTALRVCAQGDHFFQSVKTFEPTKKNMGGWLYNQCKFGLIQIENNLEIINNYITQKKLNLLDYWFWIGRKRELIAAQWLIYQLLPAEYEAKYETQITNKESVLSNESITQNLSVSSTSESSSSLTNFNLAPENIFDLTIAKIQSSLQNKTNLILEIDILKRDKQQELLLIIVQQLKRILDDLKIISLDEKSLEERHFIILKDLWQSSALTFLSRYSPEEEIQSNPYNLIDITLKYSKTIEENSLTKIPFTFNLFAYWLFKKSLKIDNKTYVYDKEETKFIEEMLLDNLILNIANIVMQFILNNFSNVPLIRYHLYNKEGNNSRNIAMFRNNLGWQYRKEKYWDNPKDIFEDQYRIFKLEYQGITTGKIAHPRNHELSQLTGLPWVVTIIIEFRDSISNGVKALGDIIGKGLVYLLTEVIGKSLGLIAKGVLQGIGKKIRN
jgi:AmiR/NasT family two-component response regulator